MLNFFGCKTRYDIRCFDLGWFPCAKCWPLEQGVECEVYAVNDRTVRNLDYLEGYLPHQLEKSTYVRKVLNTRLGGAKNIKAVLKTVPKCWIMWLIGTRLDAKSDKAIDVGHLGLYF